MDLANLNLTEMAEKGAWLTLTHPTTGADLDIRIRLAGADSPAWKKAEKSQTNKRLANLSRKGNLSMNADEIEERGIALLAAVTLAWENIEEHGQAYPCNEANARQLYRKYDWIREQVDAFVGDRSNFAHAESAPSPSVLDANARVETIVGN